MHTAALAHLRRSDKIMARLIRRVGPCELRVDRRRSPFQALVRSVTYQQLNGRAAATILGRVKALYPGRDFPSPEELSQTPDAQLRSAGLSGSKTAALKDIAAHALAGEVPTRRAALRLTDEELQERLTRIRGVGPWTVEMLLIFTLGRPDVLPATDYGVRQGYARTFARRELPTPKELMAHGERWRPHRSIAAWYLWRSLELDED